MANYTKEQRAEMEAKQREELRQEIEAQIRSEMQMKDSTNDLQKENENLKVQLTEVLKIVEELKNDTIVTNTKDKDSADLDLSTRILVTSMTVGGVNMKTANDGSARHFRLDKIGQTIPIIYEHLISCINNDRWIFEEGLVYINNEQVVSEQYLEDFYKKFLTPDKIENILDFDKSTINNMITGATPSIQETIALMVANKINSGGYVDMNKVDCIGKSCNPDIDIRELANKLR